MPAVDVTQGGMGEPGVHAALVVPSDSDSLAVISRALYVGGAGNLTVVMKGGQTVTFTAVPAGSLLPIRVTQVKSTLTTATAILNLW